MALIDRKSSDSPIDTDHYPMFPSNLSETYFVSVAMFLRSARCSIFNIRWSSPSSIPILTRQALYLHQGSTGSQFQATPHEIPPQSANSSISPSSSPSFASSERLPSRTHHGIPTNETTTTSASDFVPQTRNHIPLNKQPVSPSFTHPLTLTKSLVSMLPHLTSQPPHYISAHLHARPYLLTAGDHLRLPFLMPNVHAGDILRFNRASVIGSRDFTLKGMPYIDERMFECRVRVLGVDAEPLRIKEKTKRRQRHVRRVKSKHKYTLMRVMDVKVKTVEELLEEGAQVIEDGAEGCENSSKVETKD
jgi:large subunit ribosomal protein L21